MSKQACPWFLAAVAVTFLGCGGGPAEEPPAAVEGTVAQAEAEAEAEQAPRAVAEIAARSGSSLAGKATFDESDGMVAMTLEVEGAPPGVHAVHLHEVGDCSAEDASSAGGHWNPAASDHGQWGHAPHHLGDIGNITVGDDGYGSMTLATDMWSIGTGGDDDILGRAVVIHEKADDFTTQPTGAAGGRIGCGVIE